LGGILDPKARVAYMPTRYASNNNLKTAPALWAID